MMRQHLRFIRAVAAGFLLLGAAAQAETTGASETAGQKIDRVAQKTGDGIRHGVEWAGNGIAKGAEHAGRGINTGVQKTGEALSRVGNKIQQATGEVDLDGKNGTEPAK